MKNILLQYSTVYRYAVLYIDSRKNWLTWVPLEATVMWLDLQEKFCWLLNPVLYTNAYDVQYITDNYILLYMLQFDFIKNLNTHKALHPTTCVLLHMYTVGCENYVCACSCFRVRQGRSSGSAVHPSWSKVFDSWHQRGLIATTCTGRKILQCAVRMMGVEEWIVSGCVNVWEYKYCTQVIVNGYLWWIYC